jgi:hypothetical protein
MPGETSIFSKIIEDHLELKRRNAGLDGQMPIDRYKGEDPFDNHPLFKTEEQARLEETMDGSELVVVAHSGPDHAWPGEEHILQASEDGLWSRSRDFDWGD